MKIRSLHMVLTIAAAFLGGCGRNAPTAPVRFVGGQGFVFESQRDFPTLEIYTLRSDGSRLKRLTNDSSNDFQPRWSPDGLRIAYIHAYAAGGYQPNVTVMDANGANSVRLIDDTGDANPSWSPDGSKIAFERDTSLFPRNQLWIVNADGTDPTLVLDSLAVHEISWTPQGNFLGADYFGIVQFNIDGTGQTRLLNLSPGTVFGVYPRLSPDGSRIVFQWGGPYGSDPNIYTVNSDGSNLRQLTDASGSKSNPVWSNDGRKIAFTSGQGNGFEIWVMDSDGSNQTRVSPPIGADWPLFQTDQLGDWR